MSNRIGNIINLILPNQSIVAIFYLFLSSTRLQLKQCIKIRFLVQRAEVIRLMFKIMELKWPVDRFYDCKQWEHQIMKIIKLLQRFLRNNISSPINFQGFIMQMPESILFNNNFVILIILLSYYYTADFEQIPHMNKRIFADKVEPPPTTELGRTPVCYYHKHPILSFCTQKRCTLPLCKECLPIHKRQHIKSKQMQSQGIVDFEKARGDALNAFQQRKSEIVAIQQKFKKRMSDFKNKMIAVISAVLDEFYVQSLAKDGNIQIISEIDQRIQQIRSGSLKQMIKYHQDIYGAQHFRKLYKLYNGQYLNNIKFDFNSKQKLQQICKEGIIDTNQPNKQKQSPDSHFQVKHKSETQIKQQQKRRQSQQTMVMNKAKQNQIFSRANDKSDSMKQRKKQQIFKQNLHQKKLNNVKEKDSSLQDDQSEIFTYNLLKSKKIQRQIEDSKDHKYSHSQSNIYTNNFNKASHTTGDNFSITNTNNNSRTKSKKKGLSLVRSHKSLHNIQPLHTGDDSKKQITYQLHQEMQNHSKRSNWRNFVKMGSIEKQRQSYLQYYEPSVLNPKQMRDLMAKKKQQDRSRLQKQLKNNKSAQLLVPVSDRRPLQ